METVHGIIALFLLIEFAAAATWSNCFNEGEVSKIFDECVIRSTRDLSRISYDPAAEEDERFDDTILTEETFYRKIRSLSNLISKREISERIFQDLFPVHPDYTTDGTVNSDVIKVNFGRVAKPGKLRSIKKTVDECKKTYDAAWWFAVSKYEKCFMSEMETVCSTTSPDPIVDPTFTLKPLDPVTGGQNPPVTDYVKCGEDYTLNCV